MVRKEFDPIDNARPPREEGWEEETNKITEHLKKRGDQRIGQLIINAARSDMEFKDRPEFEEDVAELTDQELEERIEEMRKHRDERKARIEQRVWSMEAPELLEKLEKFMEEKE